MARKRKKRKKGEADASGGEDRADVPTDAVLDEVIDLDALVDEVIDLDDDWDDPGARAELIAEVAGLPPEPDGSPAEAAGAEATLDVPDAESADLEDPHTGDSPGAESEATPEPEGPLIGRDALAALSQFRAEGIATLPEELVLELGEATSPEERDRLLAAALAHVEMQEAIYRVRTESGTSRRWKGVIAAVIFVFALYLAGLPPSFLVPEAAPRLTPEQRVMGLRTALLVQAEQIEAFRAREGRLPVSLDELPTALPGIRMVRSGNRLYNLVAYAPDGRAIVYDSSSPDEAFSQVSASWLSTVPDS